MNNKYKWHCWTSCNCNRVKIACSAGEKYVDVKKKYPQKAYVGSFCPKGYRYIQHACGTGARKWTGTQKVQWGPYSTNSYLTNGGHCSKKCNCNTIRVRCQAVGKKLVKKVPLVKKILRKVFRKPPMPKPPKIFRRVFRRRRWR